jgi:hypothetical protein
MEYKFCEIVAIHHRARQFSETSNFPWRPYIATIFQLILEKTGLLGADAGHNEANTSAT